MQRVSLGILEIEENLILGVSRKNNINDVGFIGGKSEGFETSYETLCRETFEETGLIIESAVLLDEREFDGNLISTFYITSIKDMKVFDYKGYVERYDNPNEGKLSIVPFDKTFEGSYGMFNEDIWFKKNSFLGDDPSYLAFKSKDLKHFLHHFLPVKYSGTICRIIESGVEFSESNDEPWLIGISDINKTIRYGSTFLETMFKSCMFITHDTFHNIFGLPYIHSFKEDDMNYLMRAQMSGEVAVLYITEFLLAKSLVLETNYYSPFVSKRNALNMLFPEDVFGKLTTHQEIVTRLDMVIHKKHIESWVYSTESSKAFFDDYIPMLERDRENIRENFKIMKDNGFIPAIYNNTRFSREMTSQELTIWMVNEFLHTTRTDIAIDNDVQRLYRKRRLEVSKLIPKDWVY